MSANVCIHVEKIGKQPNVHINRHSTKLSVSHFWSAQIKLKEFASLAVMTREEKVIVQSLKYYLFLGAWTKNVNSTSDQTKLRIVNKL